MVSEQRTSILICCFTWILGLLAADVAQAATYTMFGRLQQSNDIVLLRSMPGTGTVTGPASHSGSVMIPGGRFHSTGTEFKFWPQFPNHAQNASSFTSSQTASHTLAVGGGPGDFEFCPPIGNPLNPACNQAAGLAGYLGFVGFVDYDPGPNQFGGTFRVARKVQNVYSKRIAISPSQFVHQKAIHGPLPAQAGGPPASYFPTTMAAGRADWLPGAPTISQHVQATPGVVTMSPVLKGGEGWIRTQGPPGTAVPSTPLPSTTTGFPFTTGMVRALGMSTFRLVAYTLTGGNYRGPDGQGNIVLVAGGVYQTRLGASSVVYATMKVGLVDTSLPEPTMGLGLMGGIGVLLALVGVRSRRTRSTPATGTSTIRRRYPG